MKVIIAGSRNIEDPRLVEEAIRDSGFEVTTLVSGCAMGVDIVGIMWAEDHNIPILRFPANWSKYGRRAGFIRNKEMSEVGEALIAVWDGESNGTKNMISLMRAKNVPVYVKVRS